MPERTHSGLIVVSDLDGSLLDAVTYSAAPAAPVIDRMMRAGVPLVICSSKTRAEIEVVMARLDINQPFISENGGAVYLPRDTCGDLNTGGDLVGGSIRIELGRRYQEIVAILRDVAAAREVRISGFADMSVAEIARDCGLSALDAQLAKLREYDEPFRLLEPDAGACSRFLRALHHRGLRTVHGGRYYHATGDTDKGMAAGVVLSVLNQRGPALSVGLGDGLNDISLLRAVDVPIIIRNETVASTPRLLRKVPTAAVTDQPGPVGWAAAVSQVLDEWEAGRLRPGVRASRR